MTKKFLYVRRALRLESLNKFILVGLVCAQIAVSFLDLIGIYLINTMAVLSTSQFGKNNSSLPFSNYIKNFLNLDDTEKSIFLLAFLAIFFFLTRGFLFMLISRKISNYLAKVEAKYAESLVSKLMNAPYEWLKNQDSHYLSVAITVGVSAISTNLLGQAIILATEVFVIAAIFVLFIYVNTFVTLFLIVFLGVVVTILRKLMSNKVMITNTRLGELQILNQKTIFESLQLIRELRISAKTGFFENRFNRLSREKAKNFGYDMWLQQIPKYFLEFSIFLGLGIILLMCIVLNPASTIIIIISYLAAASRILPSLLRIQSAIQSIESRKNYARMTLDLESNLIKTSNDVHPTSIFNAKDSYSPNLFSIKFENVGLVTYDNFTILKGVNFDLVTGDKVAIVGPSGSGKSSLLDLLSGVAVQTHGNIYFCGKNIKEILEDYWTFISYSPQETKLFDGTVYQNVLLNPDLIDDANTKAIDELLTGLYLKFNSDSFPYSKDEVLLGNNNTLSGGQRQKIGLARSLHKSSEILILDEPSSSLDMSAEKFIIESLIEKNHFKIIIIATHRLELLVNCNKILFLSGEGECLVGSLSDLLDRSSEFRKFYNLTS